MPSVISSDPDAGIRVAITPSQSAYFAGEPFSVTITFTNTRSSEPGPSKPSSAYGHKRGAHSISSAPLSRPPTSPGTPRLTPAALPISRSKSNTDAPIRKGLVGNDSELTLDQRRKRLLGKSLSVSIAPPDLDAQVSQTPSAGPYQRSFHDSATFHRSPLVPSTIPRTDTLPLSQHHPHARKQSIADTSHHVPESPMTPNSSTSSFSGALDPIGEARASYPNTPTLSTPSIEPASPSRFHHGSVYGFPSSSASSSTSSLSRSRHSTIGLGHPGYIPAPRPANTELILYSYAQLTGSVVITPVGGVNPTPEQMHNLKHIRASLLKRNVVGGGSMDINSSLLNRTPSTNEFPISPTGVAGRQMMKGHGRSSSLTGALFSMLSPSSLVGSFSASSSGTTSPLSSSQVPPGSRWRTSSSASSLNEGIEPASPNTPTPSSGQGLGLGLGLPNERDVVPQNRMRRGSNSSTISNTGVHSRRSSVAWIMGGAGGVEASSGLNAPSTGDPNSEAEAALPTFEVQPAMLAVDLALAPGESKSYTYTVNLPDNLPPTFRGKAIRFSYELVVGLCRGGQGPGPSAPSGNGVATPTSGDHQLHSAAPPTNVSKLMKVPIRMYNNVVVDRPPKPYNLLWPVDKRMDLAMPRSQAKVVENDDSRLHASTSAKSSIKTSLSMAKGKATEGGLEDLLSYTRRLLETLPEPEVASPMSPSSIGPSLSRFSRAGGSDAPLPPLPTSPVRDADDRSVSASSPSLTSTTPPPQSSSSLETSPAGSEKEHGSRHNPQDSASDALASLPPLPPSPTTSPTSEESLHSIRKTSPPTTPSTTAKELLAQDKSATITRPKPRRPATLDLDQGWEVDSGMGSGGDSALAGGCREAVEILTRTQKKASYDVTKDGVQVATLTFPKSSYRLGETISGIVEINERKGRSRVLQLSAYLEAHESLPASLLPPSANKLLKRTYAEHYSSSLLNTLRTTFSLDIPSDSSPAFQTCVGTPHVPNSPGGTTSFGGVEWKVRLSLLVAVASEDADAGTEGVRFKSLVRDGPRGEWGSEWKAPEVACPMVKLKPPLVRKGRPSSLLISSSRSSERVVSPLGSANYSARSTSWTAFFASYLSPSMEREYHDGDELADEDEEDEGGKYPSNRHSTTGSFAGWFEFHHWTGNFRCFPLATPLTPGSVADEAFEAMRRGRMEDMMG